METCVTVEVMILVSRRMISHFARSLSSHSFSIQRKMNSEYEMILFPLNSTLQLPMLAWVSVHRTVFSG